MFQLSMVWLQTTLEAADLAFGSHRLGAVVDRSANTGSVTTGLFHLLIMRLMRRKSELNTLDGPRRLPSPAVRSGVTIGIELATSWAKALAPPRHRLM